MEADTRNIQDILPFVFPFSLSLEVKFWILLCMSFCLDFCLRVYIFMVRTLIKNKFMEDFLYLCIILACPSYSCCISYTRACVIFSEEDDHVYVLYAPSFMWKLSPVLLRNFVGLCFVIRQSQLVIQPSLLSYIHTQKNIKTI